MHKGSIVKNPNFSGKRVFVLQVLLFDFTNTIWQLCIDFTPLESPLNILYNCIFLW